MRRISLYRFLLLLIVLGSCHKPLAPEFKHVDNLEIENMDNGKINLKGTAVFYNPNKMKLTLLDGEVVVSMDGNYLSTIQEEYNMKLEPESDFSIPLEVTLSPNKIKTSLISSALGILSGKKLVFGFVGEIRVKAYGVPIKVPIDDEQEVDIKLW